MNVGAKFEQKPMGLDTLIGILILTATYVGLVLVTLVMIKGNGVLDPIAPFVQDVMAWIEKVTGAATSAGH
jgi:hypothetical protein